jgi:predicted phage terminase large subunit-like protein
LDIENDWLFARCREVQANPDGYLDLWAREHYKSTIITFGLTLQNILQDPEITVGIFSHNRPIAKAFLRQLKREMEGNATLKALFPDILWQNPAKEAPKWSEDDGLIVKRKGNPKESSIEAWGLVDAQPTGRHFKLMVYDDVVEQGAVGTTDMIAKTTESWELSRNLTSALDGRTRYIGTRYHFNDTYGEMIKRGVVKQRIYAATTNGEVAGPPVLMKQELLATKRQEMGPYTYSCQMLQNPIADSKQGFKFEWMKFYGKGSMIGEGFNKYILVDPANEKKKTSDYTSMWVIGLGADGNYYVLDIERDRWNLSERTGMLFYLHRKWRPLRVGYEKYGMQADTQALTEKMGREHYHFDVKELGGKLSKLDRIGKLIPPFEQGKFYFPESCFKTDYEGKTRDLVQTFVEEELKPFPVPNHDDMLDALARIMDENLGVIWPQGAYEIEKPKARYEPKRRRYGNVSWMSR